MGVAIARVMQQLVAGHSNSSGLELHCVGHSLGAQICGFTGKAVKKDQQNNPDTVLGRISGLDPAGPSFMKVMMIIMMTVLHEGNDDDNDDYNDDRPS